MDVFLTLLVKLSPLYLLIGLGFIGGRFLQVESRNFAGLMIYILTPIVIFSGTLQADISPAMVLIPVWMWGLSALNGGVFLRLGKKLLGDNRANILALLVGTGNTGYFGIPVALLLFPADQVGLYIIAMLGVTLYENSLGFYWAANGRYTARESFIKVLRLPSLYAFLLGLLLNFSGASMPLILTSMVENVRGAYTVLGMMIIGVGISQIKVEAASLRFASLVLTGKFITWPLLALTLVSLDRWILHAYSEQIHASILLVSITPLAANTVVIASLLDIHPQRVALLTLVSTLIALVYIPLMVGLLGIR